MKKALKIFVVFTMLLSILIMPTAAMAVSGESVEDVPVIDGFKPGVYGGISFESYADVVDYYVKAYNYTKSLTKKYSKNGKKATAYKLLGDDNFVIDDVLVDGKTNPIINKLVPSVASGMFAPKPCGLAPSYSSDPSKDNDKKHDYRESMLTVDDVIACNVVDNKNGTITITIQPKATGMSVRGEDSQGRFFNVYDDIYDRLNDIAVLSFAKGSLKENTTVSYKGGSGSVTIDTKTAEIVEAEYYTCFNISLKHATIAVIKDKNMSVNVMRENRYPANDFVEKYNLETSTPKITKTKAGRKKFTVKWNKLSGVKGYQVKYSKNKNMKNAKKITVKGAKNTKAVVKKLKSGKAYYVRVRAYKIIDGEKVFSKWSAKKKVKTK